MNNECKVVFKEVASIHVCHAGPMLSPDIEMEDVPSLELDDEDDDNEEPNTGKDLLEDRDQIFIATIPCEVEFICATSNVSQRLAEAFHKNTELKMFHESILTHFHDFEVLQKGKAPMGYKCLKSIIQYSEVYISTGN